MPSPEAEDRRHLHREIWAVRCIGVNEICYRRHHKYLTVVVDHDRDRVI